MEQSGVLSSKGEKKRRRSQDEPGTAEGATNHPPNMILSTADLNPFDVLSGRGSQVNQYKGNIHFRSLVRDRKEDYSSTTRRHMKDLIARQIFQEVSAKQGRFLKKLDNSDPDGNWIVIDDEVAIEKVKQTLRDQEKNESHDVADAAGADPIQASLATVQESRLMADSSPGSLAFGAQISYVGTGVARGPTGSNDVEESRSAQLLREIESRQNYQTANVASRNTVPYGTTEQSIDSLMNSNVLNNQIFFLQRQQMLRQQNEQRALLRAMAGLPSANPYQSNLATALQVSNLQRNLLNNNMDDVTRMQLSLALQQSSGQLLPGMLSLSHLNSSQSIPTLDRASMIRQLLSSDNQAPNLLNVLALPGQTNLNPSPAATVSNALPDEARVRSSDPSARQLEISESKESEDTPTRLSFVELTQYRDAMTRSAMQREDDIGKHDDGESDDNRNERELGKSDEI